MKAPASYEGTAVIHGDVAAFALRLDPERWEKAFPAIWTKSYFTDPTSSLVQLGGPNGGDDEVKVGLGKPPKKEPAGPLLNDRSVDPPKRAAPIPKVMPKAMKGEARQHLLPPPNWNGFLFEEALFGGYSYRNILRVSYRSSPTAASYEYSQHACLNAARDPLTIEGGLDVDRGTASVSLKKGPKVKGKQRVEVKVSKKVRFTKPATLVDEMNDLGHLFVPLSLDSWLHDLIFKSPNGEG